MVNDEKNTTRLAKFIASSGFYSRKEAENLIINNKVKVDGQIHNNFLIINPEQSLVEIEDNIIKPVNEIKIYKFHKISGTVTTSKDPENRLTIYDSIRKNHHLPYLLKSVGRLDFNTEGLLLMTNLGKIARMLELPINNVERIYEVKLWGNCNLDNLKKILSQGVSIEGINYQPIYMEKISSKNNNHIIKLILKEGKNREIRNILAFFDLKIKSLKRIKYGPIELGKLPKEQLIELTHSEYIAVKKLISFASC